MADGRVEIKFLVDAKDIETAKKSIQDLGGSLQSALTTSANNQVAEELSKTAQNADFVADELGKIQPEADRASSAVEQIGEKSNQSTGGVKNLVSALGLFKVAAIAVNAINQSLDQAISRVDTMNAFPRMMEAVGFSARESTESIERLTDGIQGLPTRLDEVVSTTQQLALTTGELEEATELTLALNNAFLASGASSGDASRGLQQFSQMLSAGKVDMQSWRTLLETMPLALQRVAESFGYAGESAKNDLYTALQEGTVTFDQFSGKLIELNEGVGGFAELALTNSEGIATSFKNINTAVVTGVANVIQALDDLVQDLTGKNIAQHFDSIKNVVRDVFSGIASAIRGSLPYVQTAMTVFQRLIPILTSVGTAFMAYKVISQVSGWLQGLNQAAQAVAITQQALSVATATTTGTQVTATMTQRVLGTAYAILTGQISLATVATQVFNAVMSTTLGPILLVAGAIGTLIAAGSLLVDTFAVANEDVLKVTGELENAVDTTSAITEKISENQAAFEENIKEIDGNKEALKNVADELFNLAEAESQSATDKAIMKQMVDELNQSVKGLNLAYDEETNSLNMSKEAIYQKIDAMADYAKHQVALERSVEIVKELAEAELQYATNARLISEAQAELDANFWNIGGGNRALIDNIAELEEQQELLSGSMGMLREEYVTTQDVITQTMDAQVQAVEEGTQRQITAFEDLSQSQQDTLMNLQEYYTSLRDHTTNMFGQIVDVLTDADGNTRSSSDIFRELEANLVHNQQVVETWANNLASLADRGVSDGLLAELEALGAEGAPYVQALVDASKKNLGDLDSIFSQGGTDAIEALKTALGMEDIEIEGIEHIITDTETSLREQAEGASFDSVGQVIMEGVAEGITENESEVQDAMTQVMDNVPDWLSEDVDIVKDGGKEIVEAIGDGVTENEENLKEPIQRTVEKTYEVVSEERDTFVESGKEIVDGISDGVTENAEVIEEAINEAVSIPEESNLNDESTSLGKNIIDGATLGVTDNKQTFQDALRAAAEEGLSNFKSASGVASPSTLYASASADIVAGAVQGVTENQSTFVSAVRTMAQLAVSAFTQVSLQAYSAGRNLGLGFNSGLESTRDTVVSTASSIANAAANAINKALEVASPSKKGIYSGRMLGLGVGNGIEDEIAYVEQQATRLGYSAIPNFERIDLNRALKIPGVNSQGGMAMTVNVDTTADNETKELLREIAEKTPILVADDGAILAKYREPLDRLNGVIASNKASWRLDR